MIDIYASKCSSSIFFEGKSESYIRSAIKRKLDVKGDWFLTSQEAVDYGLVDSVKKA
jgi:ATP-dependent protease ClpP protease subunit